jgi:hypothetical protein
MKIKIENKLYDENSIIDFGKKYKGEVIKKIIEHDPQYLVWCHENVGFFKLPDNLYITLKNKLYNKRFSEIRDDWIPGEEDLLGHYPGDS